MSTSAVAARSASDLSANSMKPKMLNRCRPVPGSDVSSLKSVLNWSSRTCNGLADDVAALDHTVCRKDFLELDLSRIVWQVSDEDRPLVGV